MWSLCPMDITIHCRDVLQCCYSVIDKCLCLQVSQQSQEEALERKSLLVSFSHLQKINKERKGRHLAEESTREQNSVFRTPFPDGHPEHGVHHSPDATHGGGCGVQATSLLPLQYESKLVTASILGLITMAILRT